MTAFVVADILSGRYVILGGVYCVSLVEDHDGDALTQHCVSKAPYLLKQDAIPKV